jgi:uncharacterized membrane protein
MRAPPAAPKHAPFHARITPNRSLTGAQTLLLIAIISGASVTLQAVLIAAGAWPCAIFAAFDTLLAVGAIIVCQSRLQRHEEVVIADACVEIRRSNRGAHGLVAREPVFGLSVEACEDPDFGLVSLHLLNHRSRIEIARDLSPAERRGFLDAFLAAAAKAGYRPKLTVTHLLTHPVAEVAL